MTQAFLFFHFNLLCQKLAYFCFANTTAIFFPYCLLLFASFCLLHFASYFWGILPFALWKSTRFFLLCCFIRCLFVAVLALFQCLFVSTAIFLPFLYCFCPLPFAVCYLGILLFALFNFTNSLLPVALYFPLLLFSFFFV